MAKNLEYQLISGEYGAVGELIETGYRLQTARELQDDRWQDGQEALQKKGFYVANGSALYRDRKSGRLSWACTDGQHNLILKSPRRAWDLRILSEDGICRPGSARTSWNAINHESTQKFFLDDLELVLGYGNSSFMPIKTDNYGALNPEQKRAASAVGYTEQNVAYMAKKGIKEIHLGLLNSEYLTRVFAKEGKDPIWLVSSLCDDETVDQKDFSYFNARERYTDGSLLLRGVREVK
ncbi:MAG: hypothetical protein WCV90_08380 [Candidatus Woesearchaeota archaeon]|jgi:hypothetical protein